MADEYGIVKSYLELTFSDNFKGTTKILVPNPREDVTEDEIKELESHIVEKKIFIPALNGELTGMIKAKVVSTDTNKFDLA